MPRIRVLPDILVNQIAAGEVVERPASVVKELVENALDAGARTVRITLQGGGRERVEVEDDGSGMEHDDALLALERHATSKIGSAADLEAIATLGFRGEALPSIAAASAMTIETAARDGEGTRVEVAFGRITKVAPCARPRGTRVVVRDLFEQLPARRKFLRTESTELRHAVSVITGLAVTHAEVAFSLAHGKRVLLDLPATRDLAHRLPDLVGAKRAAAARPIRHTLGTVEIDGFALPASPAPETVVAINGRVVRDRVLAGAVNRALRGASGRFEADAYLEIRLPAQEVDVNVHPTKAEVRFANPGAVISALTQALAAARIALHGPIAVRPVATAEAAVGAVASQEKLPWSPYPASFPEAAFAPRNQTGERAARYETVAPPVSTPWGQYIGQYRGTYLVIETDDGLLLVDQHVAHERVLYERLLADDAAGPVQQLLLPEIVELSPALAALADEVAPELHHLGLEIEPASGGALRVLGTPAALPGGAAGRLVEEVLADLAGASGTGASVRERAAASLACHAAIKKNWLLSRVEAESLLRDLAGVREPHRCPHGRPIVLRLSHDEIERRIGRR